jgi:hypothetical protein
MIERCRTKEEENRKYFTAEQGEERRRGGERE